MKIIKKGYTKRIKKCNTCKTKFVYDVKDLLWLGKMYCPICGETLYSDSFDKIYKERRKKI